MSAEHEFSPSSLNQDQPAVVQLTRADARRLSAIVDEAQTHADGPAGYQIDADGNDALRTILGIDTTFRLRQQGGGFGLLGRVVLLESEDGASIVAIKAQAEDDEIIGLISGLAPYYREWSFYNTYFSTYTPRCYASYLDDGQVLLVLEGIASPRPLNQVQGLDRDSALAVVRDVARFHHSLSTQVRPDAYGLWGEGTYTDLVALYDRSINGFIDEFTELIGSHTRALLLRPGATIVAGVTDYLRQFAEADLDTCNFDLRADNVIRTGDETHVFIDWQFAAVGRGAMDIAHLMSTSLTSAVWRETHDDLIDLYANERTRLGQTMTSSVVREDVRIGVLTRLVLCVAAVMQFPHPFAAARAARRAAVERLLVMTEALGPWPL